VKNNKILFILKKNHNYHHKTKKKSSGLYNSAKFIVDMLRDDGFDSKIVEVVDGNDVDREITLFRPAVVVVEAYWITPAKFTELSKIHKSVKWIVRNHSKPAFLAQEGITFEWTLQYVRQGITVACNSNEATTALKYLCSSFGLNSKHIIYLPNFYRMVYNKKLPEKRKDNEIHIGCFGAIRPLKNQVNQALAAIEVADRLKKNLVFHMNGERIESGGAPVEKSLIAIFENNPKHRLILHPWLEHEDFLKLMEKMDASMQVSYSETFNIVSADAVSKNIPVVVSDEIEWVKGFICKNPNPNKVSEIADALKEILTIKWKFIMWLGCARQRMSLNDFNLMSEKIWLKVLNNGNRFR
jgi:glycosyltransferase involved in cell wall biosynthesis